MVQSVSSSSTHAADTQVTPIASDQPQAPAASASDDGVVEYPDLASLYYDAGTMSPLNPFSMVSSNF